MLSILIAALSGSALAAPMTHDQMSVVVASHTTTIGQLMDDVEDNKVRIVALESESVDCQTNPQIACDATVAKLRAEHEALAVTVGKLDKSIASVQVYLYGVGGTSTSPKSGSLEYWRQSAEKRLGDLELEVKRHKKTLYEDWNGDGVVDGGLVEQVTVLRTDVDRHEQGMVEIFGQDIDGDGVTDGVIEDTDGDGNVSYRASLVKQVAYNQAEILLGLGGVLDVRRGYTDPEGVYSVPGSGLSLDLNAWLRFNRVSKGTFGLYGAGTFGSGTGALAGVTYGWNLGNSHLALGGAFRYYELPSQIRREYSLKSVGGAGMVLGTHQFTETFGIYGRLAVTATFDAAEFEPGIFPATNIAAGALARF